MGRPTTSCVACAKRKIRCDKVKPRCGNCTQRNIECVVYLPGRFRIMQRRPTQPFGLSHGGHETISDFTLAHTTMYSPAVLTISPTEPMDLNRHHLQIFTRGPSPASQSMMDKVWLPYMMGTSDACRDTFLFATRAHYDTMRNINVPCQDVLRLKQECLKLLKRDISEWRYSPALAFAMANLAAANFIYNLPDEHGQYAQAQLAVQHLILNQVGTEGMMKGSAFDLIVLKTVILNRTFPALLTGKLNDSPFAFCDSSESWPRTDVGNEHVRESPFYCPAEFATLKGVADPAMLDLLRLIRKCLEGVSENMNQAQLASFYMYANRIYKLPSSPTDPEFESLRLAVIMILEALTKGVSLTDPVGSIDYMGQLRRQLERSELTKCWCEEKMGVLWWVLIVGSIASIQQDFHRPFFWSWLQFMSIQFLGGQPSWWSLIIPVRRMRDVIQATLQKSAGPDAHHLIPVKGEEDTP